MKHSIGFKGDQKPEEKNMFDPYITNPADILL